MNKFTSLIVLASFTAIHCQSQPASDDKDAVLPGRHMSEHQVVDAAVKALSKVIPISCDFKDGIWNISEVQKGVWGVSSMTTNAAGHIFVTSTNATRVIMKIRDVDGKIEPAKSP